MGGKRQWIQVGMAVTRKNVNMLYMLVQIMLQTTYFFLINKTFSPLKSHCELSGSQIPNYTLTIAVVPNIKTQ